MTASSKPKVCLIAGGGALPVEAAAQVRASGRPYVVIRIEGVTEPELDAHPGLSISLGRFGEMFAFMAAEQVRSVCMMGYVQRPDFATLSRDEGGEKHLATIQEAGRGGDDSLLRQVAAMFVQQGLTIEGVHEAAPDLLIGNGVQTGALSDEAASDLKRALDVASVMGAEDIGQAVVVAGGVTLAVEAQEGTEAMLKRLTTLNPALLGTARLRRGVLVKIPKPIQDMRLDMPTIGVSTVDDAAAAGLAGIAGRAGGLLVVNKPQVLARAAELGLFIIGVDDE